MANTATSKAVNYTPEQTLNLLAAYAAGTSVETLAAELGKTVRSVVAKLSREGVYQKKTYVSKTGEAVVKKDALADKMAEVFGLTEAEADSLTKANKTALKKILDKMAQA
jgi:flavoprotein